MFIIVIIIIFFFFFHLFIHVFLHCIFHFSISAILKKKKIYALYKLFCHTCVTSKMLLQPVPS